MVGFTNVKPTPLNRVGVAQRRYTYVCLYVCLSSLSVVCDCVALYPLALCCSAELQACCQRLGAGTNIMGLEPHTEYEWTNEWISFNKLSGSAEAARPNGKNLRPGGPIARVEFLGRGRRDPSHEERDLGKPCKLSQRGLGEPFPLEDFLAF